MPVSYTPADDKVINRVNAMLKKYHGDLVDAGVTFNVQMAAAKLNEDGEGTDANPVTINGYSRVAKIKIYPLADRAEKMPDFRLTLDEKIFEAANVDEKNAIIDGQLERLELKNDSENAVKRDDQGRPILKLRKWDHCYQWFDSVADRHKGASVEVQEAKAFFDQHGQAWFGPMLWDSPDGKAPAPTATEALDTITGGDAGADANPKSDPDNSEKPKRFRGNRHLKKQKLPAVPHPAGEAWAAQQRPPQPAIAN